MEEINKIIVDVAIKDQIGNTFWKDELIGRETLPLDEFLEQFRFYLEANTSFNSDKEKEVPSLDSSEEELQNVSEHQLSLYSTLSTDAAQRAENEMIRRYGSNSLHPVQIFVDDDNFLNFFCLRQLLRLFFNFFYFYFLLIKTKEIKLAAEGVDSTGEILSLERFGFILSLFGPIVDPNSKRVVIFDKVFLTSII